MVTPTHSEFQDSPLLKTSAILSFCVILLHVAGYFVPSGLTWGFNYFAFLPIHFLIGYILLGTTLLLFVLKGTFELHLRKLSSIIEQHPWRFLFIICALFTCFVLFFQVKVPLLGDSFIIIKNYTNEFSGVKNLWTFRSPLAVYYFSLIMRAFEWTQYPAMLSAFVLGEIVLGTGFIVFTFLTLKNLFTDPMAQLTSFLFSLCLPYMQIFFGYVEVYAVLLFALSFFLWSVSLYINGKINFSIVVLVFLVMIFSHLITMLLAPAMLYLAYIEMRKNGYKRPLLSAGMVGIILLMILISIQFDLRKIINITPHSNFLTPGNEKEPYKAYSLFSVYHFTDLFNTFFLISPFTLIFLAVGIPQLKKLASKPPLVIFFLISTICIFIFVLMAKFDLGMARDWDITASLMIVPTLFVTMVVIARWGNSILPALQVAVVTMTLTALPWFFLNSSVEENIKRSESYLDTRVVSREGYYLATIHLTSYYLNVSDIENITSVLERYITLYPNDFWVYQMLTRALIDINGRKDPKIEQVFTRWLMHAPSDTVGKNEFATFEMELGKEYYREGKLDSALYKFEQTISMNPQSFSAYNNVGLIYSQRNDFPTAMQYFKKAIDINPGYTLVYSNIANIYVQTNRIDSAIVILQQAIEIDEYNFTTYENLSKTYYRQGNKEMALATLKQAARLGSKTAQYLLRLSGEQW